MPTASFWKIEVEVSKELVRTLEKLAQRRLVTVPKLIDQALQDYLKRSESELTAPVVDEKKAGFLRKTARVNNVSLEILTKDFSKLSEDTLIKKYHVGQRATAELRDYVRSGGR